MRVEILKPIQGKAYFEGDVIELPDDQARNLIEAGFCIPAKEVFVFPDDLPASPETGDRKPETAESKVVPEKAIRKSGKKA